MSRDLIAFLALGASLALGAVVEATDVPQLGDSVHVSARSAAPGEAIELWVSSPYPNRPFSVLASSPSRELFEVASGTTGASGDASLSLQLVDEPTLAGVDLRLAIELEPDAGAVVRSREILLEALPVDDAGGSARETAFEIATDLLPQDTPIGLVAELVDLDGDGDADLLLAVGDDPESGPLRVLVNDGTGHFADESALRLPDLGSSTGRALLVADIDLDSDLDVLVLTGVGEPAHILLRNDGEGRFALDESFPEKHAPDARANGGVFADLDGD
ncbi:MAG TPA: FG-GAP-like repeat-containing protein, partial [Planctomycetota bacterium]|nr:FG-GAP-like repeat-containing protein [Planctomycetota bacterium]